MTHRRVVHLTSVHSPFDVRILHKECKSLAKAGFEVTLVVPHDRDEASGGVRIKALPKIKGRVSRMTRTVWRVFQEAVRLDADVYHFHDPELIPVGVLLRVKGKKVIYDIHEDVPRDILSKHYLAHGSRWLLGRLAELVENLACRSFSALVPATPAIAERFADLNNNRVMVQNFPILEELALSCDVAWSQRVCSVAYVGVISENRGIRQMVRAMELIPDGLGATLRLAGGFSPAHLHREVVQLPGWKRVQYLGFLDRSGVAKLLAEVRAGLVLFQPDPNHVEAQPNKLFEYMSAGIAVIASDFPRWRQIIEGAACGLLVDPRDPKGIAEAIGYVLTHPQEAEAMGKGGRRAVEERYNWGNEESRLLQLYKEVTGAAL